MKIAKFWSFILLGVLLSTQAMGLDSSTQNYNSYIGKNYSWVREELIKNGWMPDIFETDNKDTHYDDIHFKEITCGVGWNAACSAGFTKPNDENGIIVSLSYDLDMKIWKVTAVDKE